MNWRPLLLIPFFALFIGCASPRGEVKNAETESDSLQVDELMTLLPSAGEFLAMVHDVDMGYIDGITRPIVSTDSFALYRNQALNFGVYLTDFSYLLIFEKQSESIKYLYHIQEMSQKLGVENYFDDEFFNRLLVNLENPDSLKRISLQQSTLFFNRMNEIGNKDLVFLITSGSLIEAMHIASVTTDENNITEEVIKRTIDLAYIFDSFYLQLIISKHEDFDVKMLVSDIKELREIFTSMTIAQNSKAIREKNNVIIKSEVTHDINQYNISKMKDLVGIIRSRVVNQKY